MTHSSDQIALELELEPPTVPMSPFSVTFDHFPDSMPLGIARAKLAEMVEEGTTCPACTQHAQVYRWSLYSTAVRMLARLWHVGGTSEFVESKAVKAAGDGGHCSQLRHWGLVEQESERRPDGGKSGWWRVTKVGADFLQGRVTIPKYVYVYDGTCLRSDGPPVTVRECLGKKFDYDLMMAGAM